MSQENVELLRDMYGQDPLFEFAESLHPQAELHQAKRHAGCGRLLRRDEFLRGALLWHEE